MAQPCLEAEHQQLPTPLPISGVVVAGGMSRRMGHDKRRLRLWGATSPTLLEHTVAFVQRMCDEVIVVLNDAADWPQLHARIVADLYPDGSALGGIFSGLQAAQHDYAFVLAADMPLLNAPLVRWMIAQPRTYDVLIPQTANGMGTRNRLGFQSLHAIYSRACLSPIQAQLDGGNMQVIGFFPRVRVQVIGPDVIAAFDPDGTAFFNINTPADVERVHATIQTSGEGRGS